MNNNVIQDLIFSWGCFLAFLVLFYKKMFPTLQNTVMEFIQKKKENRISILNGLKAVEQQYNHHQNVKKQLIGALESNQKEAEKLDQGLTVKVKTMKYNSDVQRQKNQKYLMDFYKKKQVNHWLMANKLFICELIKKENFNDEYTVPVEKPQSKFNLDILKAIDDW
jgi:c-di-AMP phosphodiesterase-like protein